jgi:dCMP deaminase
MQRPSLDAYFMEIAQVVSSRSTCLRNSVGAILVKDKQAIALGYNGAPTALPHCTDIGCIRTGIPSGERSELCRAVHAEQSALIQAALHGISPKGSTMYCTHQPCSTCAKMLINAGIKKVVYKNTYADQLGIQLLHEAKIEVVHHTCPAALSQLQ